MKTLIIANGITRDYLDLEEPFSSSKKNLGQAEIERLFGKNLDLSSGPLGQFFLDISNQKNSSALVVLKNTTFNQQFGDYDREFPLPLDEILKSSNIIEVDSNELPLFKIDSFIKNKWGDSDDLNIILVGGHTEGKVLFLAGGLKNALGYKNVAVCSHLLGSSNQDGHFGALKNQYLSSDVEVFQTLEDTWKYAGLKSENLNHFKKRPCQVEPEEMRELLGEDPEKIVQLLCMNLTEVSLRPLQGGFSGSFLFLADGFKGQAHTEPLVIKIDNYAQMRRELNGYYRVKDFLGKNVPSFDAPVTIGDRIGVAMELASMEGSPETLQDSFEDIDNDIKLNHFLKRLEKSLKLISEKLYQNTVIQEWQGPYRLFGLHTQQQANWLEENGNVALTYLGEKLAKQQKIDLKKLKKVFRLISANEDGVVGPECLVHGDLNLANIICDKGDNIWFIDWTHCSSLAGALDFAKMENDAKFVMSKDFDLGDLSNLKLFEDHLLANQKLGEIENLPSSLKFVKWDLRFRKVYSSIKLIRESYFKLSGENNWLLYRIGLLRYSLHTLSFDKKRDRGECEPVQLVYALFSSQSLIFDLAGDDFNLRTRGEKAPNYPDRYRLFIDEAPWILDCDHYAPPYYVDEAVLKNNYKEVKGGWADPESIEKDLPLNPRGRTGIKGRGSLGLWGANNAAGLIVTRTNNKTNSLEVLLGRHYGEKTSVIPKGFLLPEESYENAVQRILRRETGIEDNKSTPMEIYSGYVYDPRQTDNAWVEMNSYLINLSEDEAEKWSELKANDIFEEIKWMPLDPETINLLPSFQAALVRDAVKLLNKQNLLNDEMTKKFLDATG